MLLNKFTYGGELTAHSNYNSGSPRIGSRRIGKIIKTKPTTINKKKRRRNNHRPSSSKETNNSNMSMSTATTKQQGPRDYEENLTEGFANICLQSDYSISLESSCLDNSDGGSSFNFNTPTFEMRPRTYSYNVPLQPLMSLFDISDGCEVIATSA